MTKKLYKSSSDKVLAGVIGGVGEYFDTDPTLLRLGYVLLAILTHVFPALIAYVIAALIVPKNPHPHIHHVDHTEKKEEPKTE